MANVLATASAVVIGLGLDYLNQLIYSRGGGDCYNGVKMVGLLPREGVMEVTLSLLHRFPLMVFLH